MGAKGGSDGGAKGKGIFSGCAAPESAWISLVNLHILPAGPIETNAYLLTDGQLGEAVLIDAPGDVWAEVEPILRAEGCKLRELWLTHGHWDHTQGAPEVIAATGAKTLGHPDDRILYETPEIMEQRMRRNLGLKPLRIDRWVNQGDRITALGLEMEVRHVPGHCPGNIMFYFAAAGAAFVGDALFNGAIGRTDFPGCSFEQLEQSIRTQIYTLPDATKVYPGHGPATTVGQEKLHNPYVHG